MNWKRRQCKDDVNDNLMNYILAEMEQPVYINVTSNVTYACMYAYVIISHRSVI